MENKAWRGFKGTHWTDDVNVRDFIQNNYTVYTGDESFLEGPTEATDKLWGRLQELQKEERARGGVLECETEVVTGLTAYGPGYIDPEMKGLEKVVGLQTDKPLKRAFMPYGGIKMAMQAAKTYGYEVNPKFNKIFTEYHKTHNQAVFDAYTPEMKNARHTHIVTGLPDTYGRGRIVGDYRRVALYGVDFLIRKKQEDLMNCGHGEMTDNIIRQREELAEQIKALNKMKEMALIYGFDISVPAVNAAEAVQWLYFGYRNSEPTTSILTITSNVVYGKATGATPDGREAYKPFAPGVNPSYGAEKEGLLASLNSVAKVPYEYALDGISNTQTISPEALGHMLEERKNTLVSVMDGYFDRGAHHLNVNVFGTEKLIDCMEHPEKPEYANFTIRVSGLFYSNKEQYIVVQKCTNIYRILFTMANVCTIIYVWMCTLKVRRFLCMYKSSDFTKPVYKTGEIM